MQSKRRSFIEACTNVCLGIVLAWGVTFAVFPAFGYAPTVMKSLWISLIFTAVSLVRSYVLRRLFNTFDTPRKSYRFYRELE